MHREYSIPNFEYSGIGEKYLPSGAVEIIDQRQLRHQVFTRGALWDRCGAGADGKTWRMEARGSSGVILRECSAAGATRVSLLP